MTGVIFDVVVLDGGAGDTVDGYAITGEAALSSVDRAALDGGVGGGDCDQVNIGALGQSYSSLAFKGSASLV